MSGVAKTTYSIAASTFHWAVAIPMIGSIGSVLKCQSLPKGHPDKGKWMYRHKSLGLLSGMIVAPRVAYRVMARLSAYRVQPLVGSAEWEHKAGSAGHALLYAFMTVMPATGIAMGYYGGKGLPFFYTTIGGASTPNGGIAKQAFQIHKQVGTYGKYLVPIHAGAAVQHYFRGQAIFRRINPFRASRG